MPPFLKKQSSEASLGGEGDHDQMRRFPRILPVGTHGDHESVRARKDAILQALKDACTNKAFADLLLNGVIVDNTTAGKEADEDPAFQDIRQIADKFASEDLAIDTPITWVLFRKVFERYSRDKPVVPLEEVRELAMACSIPEAAVTSVLAFYHDLSVFFHYTSVPSLRSKVIADAQWLIRQMAKIMALEGFEEYKNDLLWRLLREEGILVETLYKQVFSSGSKLEPQAIVDLLEHFLIISPIYTENKHPYKGREYFVPSILPLCTSPSLDTPLQSSAPLHLVFNTNYLVPGYFPRLVTVLSKHPMLSVDFSSKLSRNAIRFHYGSPEQLLDRVLVTENKSSISIQVHRMTPRTYRCPPFDVSCHQLITILEESFPEVEQWLPIKVNFASQCKGCATGEDHFVLLKQLPCEQLKPCVLCQNSKQVVLPPDQFWHYSKEVCKIYIIVFHYLFCCRYWMVRPTLRMLRLIALLWKWLRLGRDRNWWKLWR